MAGKGDIVEQALKLITGGGQKTAPVSRLGMNYKDVTKRVPELTEAAKRVQAGEIGQPEYSALVDRFKPVEPYASVPEPASTEAMINALTANKRDKVGKLGEYPEGHQVALRLDIPAYTGHGVWVPTIHDQKTFKTISHEPAAHIYGAQFSIPENKALAVAAGGAKGPFATIDGSLLKTPPEDIQRRAQEAINNPEWAQVGMDPERHSYFYDRRTKQPVLSAEEVIQVGPLVLARKPVYGKSEDFKYASGGRTGYGPGGVIDDIVKMAGKLISGADEPAKTGIRAYHGSPHDFPPVRLIEMPDGQRLYQNMNELADTPQGAKIIQEYPLGRFDLSKIGTGEGAQAYGHGLYFAEAEDVAQGYKQRLANVDASEADKIGIPPKHWNAFTMFAKQADETQADAAARDFAQWTGSDYTPDLVKAFDNTLKSRGRMYEVNIDADPDSFLDWDKPLSEQPEAVRTALSSVMPEYKTRNIAGAPHAFVNDRMIELENPEISGRDAYVLSRMGKQGPTTREQAAAASSVLRKAGIPGIKYLDAGSRGAGDGTRNYVVFDDKLISIIRKYGIAGASAMLGYNLMEQLDPKQALAASMADQDFQSSRPQRSMGGNNSISGALNVARGLHGGM